MTDDAIHVMISIDKVDGEPMRIVMDNIANDRPHKEALELLQYMPNESRMPA